MAKPKPAPSAVRELLTEKLVGGRYSDLANYSELFDRTSDGILLVDPVSGEVLQANPAALAFFGKPAAAMEGDRLEKLLPQEHREFATNGARDCELELGGMNLFISRAPLRLADYCTIDQILVRDITAEKEKQRELESLTLTDEMTGIANFRAFKTRHSLEHERAQKKQTAYSVLFFDIDHFKHYNDRNGHPAGDEALQIIARTLRRQCDRSQFLARYGGEEFVILVPGMDTTTATAFAEKCRQAIFATEFPHGAHQPLGRVTTSIGLCAFDGELSAADVLRCADEGLYRAKKSGRNRVEPVTRAVQKVG